MSDEQGKASGTFAPWQPVAVIDLDKTPARPQKSHWLLSFACAAINFSLFLGWAKLSTAYDSLMHAEPPLRPITLESIRSWAITGCALLAVGSILLGCVLGLWIADLRQQRTRKQSAAP